MTHPHDVGSFRHPQKEESIMLYCAFVLAMLAASVSTLVLFLTIDHRVGLDFTTMLRGCLTSCVEATSGLLGVASLHHLGVPLFGRSINDGVTIGVFAAALTFGALIGARELLVESARSSY